MGVPCLGRTVNSRGQLHCVCDIILAELDIVIVAKACKIALDIVSHNLIGALEEVDDTLIERRTIASLILGQRDDVHVTWRQISERMVRNRTRPRERAGQNEDSDFAAPHLLSSCVHCEWEATINTRREIGERG